LLKEIKSKYAGDDKESKKMNKRLQYAIDRLNGKRSIFAIENVEWSEEEEETEPAFLVSPVKRKPIAKKQNSSYRRRHSLQVGTNWLQEFSGFNMN
jgi:CRISPR/Cas system-associated protein Cas5 (RAMP superfamily)